MDGEPGFCSRFDEHLAAAGPAAVFLRDPEGRLRFDPEWTRDAWGRLGPDPDPEALVREPCWALARDADSGYVMLVLATAPALLRDHPRLSFRRFEDASAALTALAALGRPPLAADPW